MKSDGVDLEAGGHSTALRVTKETFMRYHLAMGHLVNHMKLGAGTNTSGSAQSASTANWACFYALQPEVFADKKAQVGTTILTAALLCGFAMTQFIDPPISCREEPCTPREENLFKSFAFLVGLSSCLFLVAIILCSTELMALILPYTDMDTLENWITLGTLLDLLAITFTYLGFFLLLSSMLLAGFYQFPDTIMGFEAFAFVLTSSLAIALWAHHQNGVNRRQEVRVQEFIAAYCDKETGFLDKKYLALIQPAVVSPLVQGPKPAEDLCKLIEGAGLAPEFAFLLHDAHVTCADLFALSDVAILSILETVGIPSAGHRARITAAVRDQYARRQQHLASGSR